MSVRGQALFSVILSIWSFTSLAANEGAPPPFGLRNGTVVPIDIERVDIDYVFDVAASRASATATVRFSALQNGWPMLDLVPDPTSVSFDGVDVPLADFQAVADPNQVTRVRVLSKNVVAGQDHVLVINYALRAADVTFSSGRVRTGFFMSDLTTGGRAFFEKYGPANYEYDQIDYRFEVQVNGTNVAHEIFTNAAMESLGSNHWALDFPDYFTTSSPYFHLADVGRFKSARYDYQGLQAVIPVTVYAESQSLVDQAATRVRSLLAELEGVYGPYTHENYVAYITPSGGGMEYGGATMTSMSALGHETTHFWFARGVMPVNGNSGWIDEAIASWRDDGYPRRSAPSRSPVNLGGFSPYRRHTTMDAYSLGAQLIAEFDGMFAAQGGMKPILRSLFAAKQRATITLDYFKQHLEAETGADLDAIFNRYVLGQTSILEPSVPEKTFEMPINHHPRPYTEAELVQFR
jgi:hypothetical protein